MNAPEREAQTKTRRTLLAIITVFALPLVLAWVFTMGPLDLWSVKTINYGVLLQPPLQLKSYGVTDAGGETLSVDVTTRDWFLVVLHDAPCTEPCQNLLQIAERIQIAVGRDIHRITLVLLGPDDAPVPRGQNWLLPKNSKLISELRRAMDNPQLDPILLIVDYQGHIVLTYPPTEDGHGALNDLKRLLRASAR